jgi:putative PIN family toxin of toxin-antitoxin system
MPGLRVVLDTNVLISGVAFPQGIPGRLVRLFQRGALDVVLSHYILDEMVRVLPRLPQNKRSSDEIRNLAESFVLLAEMIEPDVSPDGNLRDPADQPVLATLRASGADYLITGDKDFLALAESYPIVTPAAFWERHG